MHKYFELLARIIHEHGFESCVEQPEHEVDTPRHFIRTRPWKLGPVPLWPGHAIAEIISEAFGGHELDDRESADPVENALAFEGLRIHVMRARYRDRLVKLMDHLRQALKEPVSEE